MRRNSSPRRACAFLDRDGTIIAERHYLSDPDDIVLLPGAAAGLRRLRNLNFALVVVTNQSAVARGYVTYERLLEIHARLGSMLLAEGVTLDALYCCPHHPEDGCGCRKPAPGLVERAVRELDIDLGRSFVIGDQSADLELGRRIGAPAVLVLTGYGLETRAGAAKFDYCAEDLREAAEIVADRISK